MDLPGRVNNLYKEKFVIEPTYEIKPIVEEKSQGCSLARNAGYGTFEYCTQPSDPINIPPRYFQLDENVRYQNEILPIKQFNYTPWIVLLVIIFILYNLAQR